MTSDSEFFKSIGIDLDEPPQQSKTLIEKSSESSSSDSGSSILNSISPSTFALASVAAASMVMGFFGTLALAKKRDGASLDKALSPRRGMSESGTKLAFRALGWGTFYAVSGFSVVSLIIYQFAKFRFSPSKDRIEHNKVKSNDLT